MSDRDVGPLREDPGSVAAVVSLVILGVSMLAQYVLDPGEAAWGPVEKLGWVLAAVPWVYLGWRWVQEHARGW